MEQIDYSWLKDHDACAGAIKWLRSLADDMDIASTWQICENGSWMLWFMQERGIDEKILLELSLLMLQTPLGDGRVVEDLLTDERSIAFVAFQRRKLAGETIDAAAWDAAWDAAWAAAGNAAWTAAWDAARTAAGNAAWTAAWDAAGRWQADKVREIVPDIMTLMKVEAQS